MNLFSNRFTKTLQISIPRSPACPASHLARAGKGAKGGRDDHTGCSAGIDINYLLIAQARKQPMS